MTRTVAVLVLMGLSTSVALPGDARGQALPGTKLLEGKEDYARVMVDGIHRYLDRALAQAPKLRQARWKPDTSSAAAYARSVEPQRQRLRKILGVIDERLPVAMHYVGTTAAPALLAKTSKYAVYRVRWTVLPGIDGEGLLIEPVGTPTACVVAIPDADQTPEMIVGLTKGVPEKSQFARQLAENGCRVVVPVLIDRKDTWSGTKKFNRHTNQTHREFVYRMAYEMGRHIIGYEIQRVLAAVDWLSEEKNHAPIALYGYGEGGLIALYAGAIDTRITTSVVSGHVAPRENLHEQPIYRNVWSLLTEFGDGEMQHLYVPRTLHIEHASFDLKGGPPAAKGRFGAAPGSVKIPPIQTVLAEMKRIKLPDADKLPRRPMQMTFAFRTGSKVASGYTFGDQETTKTLLKDLGMKREFRGNFEPLPMMKDFDPIPRQKRLFDQLVDYTQKLQPDASQGRSDFLWSRLDKSSLPKYRKSVEPLRKYFWEEVIGKLPEPTRPMNPRTRLVYKTAKWNCYEVLLDVYDDVIAYGLLLVPNDLKKGEKRPVVVCQHGLEGRPTDVVEPKKLTRAYNSFGSRLADQGFIVFAPQVPYIFGNDFRQIVRKANPLKLSLYSFIVAQHSRILDFLETLPFVDAGRIAYYGLSYGGKVAMRIPSILTRYCLSICSGDFNEWIWKNITLDWRNSYMFTGEYEMYEFDLGNTFNYAEMAALIAPRPFMVERGHSDGVGIDEYVAFEYARVRRLYAELGIADRTEIEFFVGVHEIHLVGTLAFLRKHLDFPAK